MAPVMASKQQDLEVLENWEEIDETDVIYCTFLSLGLSLTVTSYLFCDSCV